MEQPPRHRHRRKSTRPPPHQTHRLAARLRQQTPLLPNTRLRRLVPRGAPPPLRTSLPNPILPLNTKPPTRLPTPSRLPRPAPPPHKQNQALPRRSRSTRIPPLLLNVRTSPLPLAAQELYRLQHPLLRRPGPQGQETGCTASTSPSRT